MMVRITDNRTLHSGSDIYAEITIDDDGVNAYLTAEYEGITQNTYYVGGVESLFDLYKRLHDCEITEAEYDEEFDDLMDFKYIDKSYVLERYSEQIVALNELLESAIKNEFGEYEPVYLS